MIAKTNEKISVAKSSLYAAVFIAVFKIIVGFLTGSLGIIAEALHSVFDFLASLITLFAVKIADKPADFDHNYGHGKAENFAALVETILLFVTCFWIISEAIERIISKQTHIEVSIWAYLVMIVSIIVDFSRSKALKNVAIKYNNQALYADALHFSTDIWSSFVVMLGLIFSQFNLHTADSIAAIIVALIVIFISFKLGKKTIDMLMDKSPKEIFEKVSFLIRQIKGIEKFTNLRIRQSGANYFIDTTVFVNRVLPFEVADKIVANVENKIKTEIKNSDIIVHTEPIELLNETLEEKIYLIVSKTKMRPHHIKLYYTRDVIIVALHIECIEKLSFEEAHTISENIEKDILETFPEIKKVLIHIEETTFPQQVENVTKQFQNEIEEIKKIVIEENIYECKNIFIFKDDQQKIIFSMDCIFDKKLELEEVHKKNSNVENKILSKFKTIDEVFIHSEPEK